MYFQVTLSRGEMPDHLRTTQEHLVDVLRTGESRGQVKQIKFFTRVKRKNSSIGAKAPEKVDLDYIYWRRCSFP